MKRTYKFSLAAFLLLLLFSQVAGAFTQTIQPSAATGKDNYLRQDSGGNDNYGTSISLQVDPQNTRNLRTLIQFDLSLIPAGATITSAELQLYQYGSTGAAINTEIHRITRDWSETGSTWYSYDTLFRYWTTAGGDYSANVESTLSVTTANGAWKTWDVTSLVDSWYVGTYSNYGMIILSPSGGGDSVKQFYSSDYGTATLRPKLVINYTLDSTLAISDESDLYSKYVDEQVYFYADYTNSTGATIDGNSCNISFYTGGSWTAWEPMTYNGTVQPYYYNRSFSQEEISNWNVSCANTDYSAKISNSTYAISARPTSLNIFDESDSITKYSEEQIYFYANYTYPPANPVLGASCNISFNVSGGWTAWQPMAYNATSGLYQYNSSFADYGTFNWNVTCAKAGYSPKATNSTFILTQRPTSLSIWDETAIGTPYADMEKYINDSVSFYANYTYGGTPITTAFCNISINVSGGWTPWASMSWDAGKSLYAHNHTTGFATTGVYPFNITCSKPSYSTKADNSTTTISRRFSSLSISDDTDVGIRYPGEQVYFYANYSNATNGPISAGAASCDISFNVSGGWTAWQPMAYNATSGLYQYNSSFSSPGLFNWNVSCNSPAYFPQVKNSTFAIVTPISPGVVKTGKSSYLACTVVYYRFRVYNSSAGLVDDYFNITILDPNSITMDTTLNAYPNSGTGIYLSSYAVSGSDTPGPWLMQGLVGALVRGAASFGVNP